MARIGIDVRCLADGKRTGVEEYVLSLLPRLFEIDKKNEYVLFFNSFKKSKVDFSWLDKYPQAQIKKFHIPNKLLNLLFWYCAFPKIDRLMGGVDLLFVPNIIFTSVSKKTPLLLTVHDLSFERYPEFFSRKRRLWHVFINPKKICHQAQKIITVSESTQEDIRSLYGISQKNIQVIPNALSEKFRIVDRNDPELVRVQKKYALPYRFILFLGTVEPRKNIRSLIRSFEELKRKSIQKKEDEISKYKLVIAGTAGWLFRKTFQEIENSEFRDDILTIEFVEDKDKEYVYNLASVFVYPSFFEGFGFPPLEAMRCGVPVIVSHVSSLPEVVGSSGIMIDPDRPEEIQKALQEILSNSGFKEIIEKRGIKKSEKFTWEKTAQETLKTIETILESK